MSGGESVNVEVPLSDKKPGKISIVEIRNGKINFKQKPLSFEKQSETLQEIVSFRSMLEERVKKQMPPLINFPEEHKPLIAKLAHESDKTLSMLAKHIRHELLPTPDDDEDNSLVTAALPLPTVEEAIKTVLVRNNYGLEFPLGVKVRAALCVWRWEVRSDHMDWLPTNSREKAEARLAERVQAREDLKVLLDGLPQEERDSILEDCKPNPESSKKQGKKREDAENEQGESAASKASTRTKKAQNPERAAKEREKQEKKAVRLEKERKEKDFQNKSQSLMTKFLKSKVPPKALKHQDNAVAGPSKVQSDFERVFKPFALGKDKVLAPRNWFHDQRKRRRRAVATGSHNGFITLVSEDEDDIEMITPPATEEELRAMSPRERFQNSLSILPASASSTKPRCPNPLGFKIYHRISIRDLMTQLSEAEISGNDDLVREILAKIRDRDLFPAKTLCFHTDARPGYFGTWTRSSRIIGPRRPFAKDTLVFDYAYDSGEEWEEEPVGEDVVGDGDEEDGDDDEQDSDMESWLVDDDEEPELAALSRASSPPPIFDLPAPALPKRKAEDSERTLSKKRKVVIPLVPFAKGPVWESTIGQTEYKPFKPYSIRLFNDSPCSIDPFTFVSTCLEDYRTQQRNVNVLTDGAFIVPALPPRLTTNLAICDTADDVVAGSVNLPKKVPNPKSTFPDVHMAVLVNKITQLQASSLAALVEAVYQELRDHKVKKVAIEMKIREIGLKCKDKKVWIIKPASMVPAP